MPLQSRYEEGSKDAKVDEQVVPTQESQKSVSVPVKKPEGNESALQALIKRKRVEQAKAKRKATGESDDDEDSTRGNKPLTEAEIKKIVRRYLETQSMQPDTMVFSKFLDGLNKLGSFKKVARVELLKDTLFKPFSLVDRPKMVESPKPE